MPLENTNSAVNSILDLMPPVPVDVTTIDAAITVIESNSTSQLNATIGFGGSNATLNTISANGANTNAKLDNLNIAIGLLLKPANTLAKVTEVTLVPTVSTITNAVKITDNDTRGTTATLSSVTAVAALNAGTQTLLASAAVTARKGVMILNNANRDIYVLFGTGTANVTTSFSVKVSVNSFYEVPSAFANVAIQYSISQASATGTVLVTTIN